MDLQTYKLVGDEILFGDRFWDDTKKVRCDF